MTSATAPAAYRTPYQNRVDLVARTVREHTALDEQAATDLAVHVLHAIDTIPEKIR